MIRRLLAITTLPALLGCSSVVSLNSAVPDSSAVMDSSLLGVWEAVEEDGAIDRATVTQSNPRDYHIRLVTGRADTTLLTGVAARMNGRLLLDLQPTPERVDTITRLGGLALHFQAIVTITDSGIHVAGFDADSIRAVLSKTARPALAFQIRRNNDVLLTDPSARLASGLGELTRRAHVLSPAGVWHHSNAAAAPN